MKAIYYGSILFFLSSMCLIALFSVSDGLWHIFFSLLSGYGVYRFAVLAWSEFQESRLKKNNKAQTSIRFIGHMTCYNEYRKEISS